MAELLARVATPADEQLDFAQRGSGAMWKVAKALRRGGRRLYGNAAVLGHTIRRVAAQESWQSSKSNGGDSELQPKPAAYWAPFDALLRAGTP